MSVPPEFVFRAVLVRGVRAVRQDGRLLDQIFRTLDQESAAEMRSFFQKNLIHIDINYPREALKIPAIVILLKQENEDAATFLGDSGGTSLPDEISFDSHEESPLEILGGAASLSTLTGQGKLAFGPRQVLSATNNTLRIDADDWQADQYRVGVFKLGIIGGRGAGQVRTVVSNGRNVVMVDTNWTVIPDNTSVFEIRADVEELLGQPRAIYTRESASQVERLGALQNMSYEIQVVGPNPEFTIYLHVLVKALFYVSKMFMERQGIINLKLSATDFRPRDQAQPDYAYMRAVTAQFMYPFDIWAGLGEAITAVNMSLESSSGVVLETNVNVA